jgi:hypothetical protein
MPEKTLKEFSVTLYPKPMTFTVYAEFPWQAVKIAEDDYGSGDITGYGFHKFEINELLKQ